MIADIRRTFERFALIGVWLLLIAAFGAVSPQAFLSWSNFSAILTSNAPPALLALAVIIPLTSGDFDLSAGATLTLSSCVVAVLNVSLHRPIGLALAAAIAAGAVVGGINAFFIVGFRIPSLIVTLGTTSLITGFVQWMTSSATISGVSPGLVDAVSGGHFLGLPLAFYYVVAAGLLLFYELEYTPLGRRLLFVGRGAEVARLNGVAVDRVRAGALIASGVVSAVAGVLYTGVLGSADPSSGLSFLLPAFSAAYLGATTIMPGRFNALGALVAVYFLATGISGLSMLGVPLWVTNVFNGGALILAVTVSQLTQKQRA